VNTQEMIETLEKAAAAMDRAEAEITHLRKRIDLLEADLEAKDQELAMARRRITRNMERIRRMEEGEL